MWRIAIGIIAGVAMLMMGTAASGSYIIYRDRAAFEAQLVSKTAYGFEVAEGFPVASEQWFDKSPDGQLWGWSGFRPRLMYTADSGQALVNSVEGFMLGFRFQSAVGMDVRWLAGEPGYYGGASAAFYFAGGGHSSAIGPLPADFKDSFVGIISEEPIAGFVVVFGENTSGAVDNVTLGVVPEPGGILCFASALLSLRRWRKN